MATSNDFFFEQVVVLLEFHDDLLVPSSLKASSTVTVLFIKN